MSRGSNSYFPSVRNERQKKALSMAQNRAEVFKKWLRIGNVLTFDTKPEFDRLMKKADKDFNQIIKP